MNIVTQSDVKKFISLLKAGLKAGQRKNMKVHTSTTVFDGTDVPKSHYVNIEFGFIIPHEEVESGVV